MTSLGFNRLPYENQAILKDLGFGLLLFSFIFISRYVSFEDLYQKFVLYFLNDLMGIITLIVIIVLIIFLILSYVFQYIFFNSRMM